ncbi:DUF7547 family protein [Salinirubrum litoreum]|uniref:Uncharacterized protein n=1 Tax=Salinirubrum litoreum TaxID=1126234 RepID=A0ABD5RBN5_9EURY|nr:hypothetical protein [Salinirubrum litoreum]
MSTRSDEDLADLLDELETTLSDLRAELDTERGGRGGRSRAGDPPRPPRPPSMSDLLRFTEEYTIPAIVTLLEANIRALKATQRVLRMADPERAARAESANARDRLDDAGRTALSQLERSLTDLSDALSSADLPADPESRDIVEDARSLTDEIEDRIAEARERREERDRGSGRDSTRDSSRDERGSDSGVGRDDRRERDAGSRDRGIAIDVREEGDESSDVGETGSDETATTERASASADAGEEEDVDVEAELQSIKDELGQNGADEEGKSGEDAGDEDR